MNQPLQVLLLEDSADDAALLAIELQRAGFNPACTRIETRAELAAALERQEWHLIIADYRLPKGSGLDLIEEFRRSGYRGDVIMVSAFPDLIRIEDLQRLSISQFFVKPLDLNVFNRSIDALLEIRDEMERRA